MAQAGAPHPSQSNTADTAHTLAHDLEALSTAMQAKDTVSMLAAYLKLGDAYRLSNTHRQSLKTYRSAIAVAKAKPYRAALGKLYNRIGLLYATQGKYHKAILYHRIASGTYESLHNKQGVAISLYYLGENYARVKQHQSGITALKKAKGIAQETARTDLFIPILLSLSKHYLATGQQQPAIDYAEQAFGMARAQGNKSGIASASKQLEQLYAATQNYKDAYYYLSVYESELTEIDLAAQHKKAAETAVRYRSEAKELENQQLKAQQALQADKIEMHRTILLLVSVALLLLLAIMVMLYLNKRRLRLAYTELQESNQLMHSQRNEIQNQAQELLAKNEELEKHKHFRTKIFSIISHDLRNPFNNIRGVLKLVQHNAITESQKMHALKLLNTNMEASSAMLDNILLWSKAQLEETELQLVPLSLQAVVNQNLEYAKTQALDKGIRFETSIEADVSVLADQERLNFVLRNLLLNAIKFTFVGGLVQIAARAEDDQVILTVKDDGVGIPSKNVRKLFSSERYTTPGTQNEKGTGLGLMLCKEFVENQHGTIQVDSEEGKGTVFTLTLQRAGLKQGITFTYDAKKVQHSN
ncbi:ATP-binding protein [Pontibacter sp. CAU 1760]